MGFNAISNVHVYVFSEDSSKKHKRNKMEKSKQNKLDLLREQCLIQVGNKEYKMDPKDIQGSIHPSIRNGIDTYQRRGDLPRRVRREKSEFLPIHNMESISWVDRKSVCNKASNVIDRRRKINRSTSSSCSSSCSEDDSRDKCCFDTWESVADGLNPDNSYRKNLESKSRAWSPDDVFRPRSLPRISKQQNSLLPVSAKEGYRDSAMLSWRNVVEQEDISCVCPICCEDLDMTDTSFIPCPCGFRLCLFCHKRITEVDGRCPGCRKWYGSGNAGSDLTGAPLGFQMSDSCRF